MSNLAFTPIGNQDDDGSPDAEDRAMPYPDRPLLRATSQIALVFVSLAFILGTLVVSGRDPVFSPHALAVDGTSGSSDGYGIVSMHFVVGILGALLAALSGGLTVVLDSRPWVRRLGLLVLVFVLLQVAGRAPFLEEFEGIGFSFLHPLNAQVLLCSLGLLSYAHSRELLARLNSVVSIVPSALFGPAVFVLGLSALQLLSGTFIRITDAGLAIPDFPTTGGGMFPLLTEKRILQITQLRADLGLEPASVGQMVLQLCHRIGTLLLLGAGLVLGARVLQSREFSSSRVRASAILLCVGLLAQSLVGAIMIWSLLDPIALTLHLVLSAMVLYASAMLAFKLRFQV
jgi:heme A synthase